ncbi:hypothetical protein D1B31_01050 [Neobacillus notoginsengisoli]|uniref:Uncharacterized protein n=1 Tax=Neobacillus notoginsengisoli TaxID=1578198 RepID=A0A417YZG6_9BACI|nr:hypothetical protein [Neobacillus notoginsengisoli]RHW43290.1 hypothetical protein D1B31_01050 [Neobacillus notoginsengisoli]
MKNDWERFKGIEGSLLGGIYDPQLNTHQYKKELILHATLPILEVQHPNSKETSYWKLSWFEKISGDDVLVVKEQDTPEPLNYAEINAPTQKYAIISSSFSVENKLIKKVSGYGYMEESGEELDTILLELKDMYISLRAGPAIEIRIAEKVPNIYGTILF